VAELSHFLAPLPGDAPSGADLRNDDRFHALERLTEPAVSVGRDQQNNPSAQTVSQVDWQAVLDGAGALAGTGRDLRLLVIATRALANLDGMQGLAQGLDLIAANVADFWDTLHPALRPAATPREAALRRTNALAEIENETAGPLGDIGRRVLFAPRGLGPVTGRDLMMADMDKTAVIALSPGANDKEKAAIGSQHEALVTRVKTACRAAADQEPAMLQALAAEVTAASTALVGLEGRLSERLGGNGQGVKFQRLDRFLIRAANTLRQALATAAPAAGAGPAAAEVTNLTDPAGAPVACAPVPPAQTAPAASGGGAMPDRLTNRKEVERCLDLIIEFYERTEPSSPLPLMAKRLRRMVPMDFMELMAELAPSGLKEFRAQAGADEKK
jgi:type VI secretion system protein ImpA